MRRKFLQTSILLVLCMIFSSIAALSQNDTLSFLHITDAHLMFNLENYDPQIVHHREYTRLYKEANTMFAEFMETIPDNTGSDMIIASGDVIDFYDAKTSEGNTLAYQIELFTRYLDRYHYPFFMTLGNHEIFSYRWGEERVIPDQLKAGEAKAAWIRNMDVFRDGTYYSRTFEVGSANYRLIFLDNSYYQFNKEENVVNPHIDKPQLHWLKSELAASEANNQNVIILMHIPFSDKSVQPESENELYKTVTDSSVVKLILSGHHHRDVVKCFPAKGGGEVIQVETSALVNSSKNWRLVQLTENQLSVSFTGKIESEIVLPLK